MRKYTLVTLVGKPQIDTYPKATYTFNNGEIISQEIYSLALYEHLIKFTETITDLVVVGSDESVWWQFYNCSCELIKRCIPKISDNEFLTLSAEQDITTVIKNLKELFIKYLHCNFHSVIYKSNDIVNQSSQQALAKVVIDLKIKNDIIFDITLGFRFIPWLIFAALEFKSFQENFKIESLYYGKITDRTNSLFASIKLDLSSKLFSEALIYNAYQTSGDLTVISNEISDKNLKREFDIANLAEKFGCYDIANKKFFEIKNKLINEFSESIAFNEDFFNNRLNWVTDKNEGYLIKLAEHYFSNSNYTDTILTSYLWGNANAKNSNSLKQLKNKFRTLIIHMIHDTESTTSESEFKIELKKCLVNMTSQQKTENKFNTQTKEKKSGVLISIIGYDNYWQTDYQFQESSYNQVNNVRYIGTSIASELKKNYQIEKLLVCGTETAKWDEFFESLKVLLKTPSAKIDSFIEQTKEKIKNPNSTTSFDKCILKQDVCKNINKTLESFKNELGIKVEIFCYDDTDEDNGDFNKLLEFTKKDWINNNLYLDITHGYRSIPFVMFFALLTITSRNNNQLKKVFYGYSEKCKDASKNSKGWILDEAYLLRIIKYSFDISKFRTSHNILYLKDIIHNVFQNKKIDELVLSGAMKENLHNYGESSKDFAELYKEINKLSNNINDDNIFKIIKEPLFNVMEQLQTTSNNSVNIYLDRIKFYLDNRRLSEAIFASYETYRLLGIKIYEKYLNSTTITDKYPWIKDAYQKALNNERLHSFKYNTNKKAQMVKERYVVASINRRFCMEFQKVTNRIDTFYDQISNYRKLITNEYSEENLNDLQKIIDKDILSGQSIHIEKTIRKSYELLKNYNKLANNLQ